MARKPSGNPVGRPPKPINWDQFEQLCLLQCTQSEIGSMFHVDEDTIRVRTEKHYGEEYSVVYKRFSEGGKTSLRRNQFVMSRKNCSMAIWLGKIWLGQKDPGLEDSKNDLLGVLNAAIREIQREPRVDASGRSIVEDKQFILDQGRGRGPKEVCVELGPDEIVGGDACV